MLKLIYGNNPDKESAATLSSMYGHSGFAKPVYAYYIGKNLGDAEVYAQKQQEAGLKAVVDQQQQAYAQQILDMVIKLSGKDPVAATQILKTETQSGNPYLEKFKDVTFNARTKDGWATTSAGDGYVYHVYLPTLQQAIQEGPESDLYKQTIIRLGDAKPQKPIEMQKGDKIVYVDPKTLQPIPGYGGPKWKEGEGGDSSGAGQQAKSGMLTQLTNIYSSKWIPLALENYKQQNPNAKDADFFDPYGNLKEGMIRAALTDEQKKIYDRGLIEAQDAVARGINPARAVQNYLLKVKEEYERAGQQPQQPAKPASQQSAGPQLSADGKKVIMDGKAYPIVNGEVLINGKRYKVSVK